MNLDELETELKVVKDEAYRMFDTNRSLNEHLRNSETEFYNKTIIFIGAIAGLLLPLAEYFAGKSAIYGSWLLMVSLIASVTTVCVAFMRNWLHSSLMVLEYSHNQLQVQVRIDEIAKKMYVEKARIENSALQADEEQYKKNYCEFEKVKGHYSRVIFILRVLEYSTAATFLVAIISIAVFLGMNLF